VRENLENAALKIRKRLIDSTHYPLRAKQQPLREN